eukprot:COSAG04_NODE_554_length_12674_cov_89.442068_5_plen_105_part_00
MVMEDVHRCWRVRQLPGRARASRVQGCWTADEPSGSSSREVEVEALRLSKRVKVKSTAKVLKTVKKAKAEKKQAFGKKESMYHAAPGFIEKQASGQPAGCVTLF